MRLGFNVVTIFINLFSLLVCKNLKVLAEINGDFEPYDGSTFHPILSALNDLDPTENLDDQFLQPPHPISTSMVVDSITDASSFSDVAQPSSSSPPEVEDHPQEGNQSPPSGATASDQVFTPELVIDLRQKQAQFLQPPHQTSTKRVIDSVDGISSSSNVAQPPAPNLSEFEDHHQILNQSSPIVSITSNQVSTSPTSRFSSKRPQLPRLPHSMPTKRVIDSITDVRSSSDVEQPSAPSLSEDEVHSHEQIPFSIIMNHFDIHMLIWTIISIVLTAFYVHFRTPAANEMVGDDTSKKNILSRKKIHLEELYNELGNSPNVAAVAASITTRENLLASKTIILSLEKERINLGTKMKRLKYDQLVMIQSLVDLKNLDHLMRDIRFNDEFNSLKDSTLKMEVEADFLNEQLSTFKKLTVQFANHHDCLSEELSREKKEEFAIDDEIVKLKEQLTRIDFSIDQWNKKLESKRFETDGFCRE